MKIGFFDSGLGGLTIFKEAINQFRSDYIYLGDIMNAPYGIKQKEEVKKFIFNHMEYLVNKNCGIIVIACNTATSVCIKELREKYPKTCFIGTEPAVKPALLLNNHKKVLVMATSLTLKEEKLQNLIDRLDAKNNAVLLPMDKLVRFAEDYEKINYVDAEKYIKDKFSKINFDEFSSIVLGCTHFPLFRKEFEMNIPKNIEVIDSAKGVVNNMVNHAREMGIEESDQSSINLTLTKSDSFFLEKASKILNVEKENLGYIII
ncbi:MAG: glutamate racemase [Clostridia bacterium]|nr:glutamate racemase [Clostridia bacterium]